MEEKRSLKYIKADFGLENSSKYEENSWRLSPKLAIISNLYAISRK